MQDLRDALRSFQTNDIIKDEINVELRKRKRVIDMQIGNLTLPVGAALSPMAGVTDAAMRLLCHEQGAAWSVSEMLSAKGWVYSRGKNRAARELIARMPDEGVAALQLFGREPEYLAEAARELENEGFDFFDINFGCPAPKIVGNGEGSALMKEPELIGRIVRAVVDAVRLPVTVKIRAGWDENSVNAVEVAKICEQAGARAIAVHGRTRMQQYAGRADWSVIRAVKQAVSVPVLGNGDVRSGADALRMLKETGCDAVLIARAAEGNPWIFREVKCAMEGRECPAVTERERIEMALRHLELEIRLHGERGGVLEMRKHIAWYVSGLRGAAAFKRRVTELEGAQRVRDALMEFMRELE